MVFNLFELILLKNLEQELRASHQP